MRVTHIITRLIVGGAQENTVATVLGLRQKPGVEVHLLSGPTTGPEGSLESELARKNAGPPHARARTRPPGSSAERLARAAAA
jgi:hypothetical protein